MKKIILSFLLVAMAWSAFSQGKDYNKLLLLYGQKKYEDAKQEIDKITADPKTKAKLETELWRAAIYAELFADSSLSPKYPDAGATAINAFNSYYQKDTALKAMNDNGLTRALAVLYTETFNRGVTEFKNEKWNDAFHDFKTSEELGDLVIKKGMSQQKGGIDTFRVLYAGYAAQNAQKLDSAAYYYQKLVDAKVNGKDFLDAYRFLLTYYLNKKDTDKFNTTLALAKQYYPDQNDTWSQYEMTNMTSNASVDEIYQKYKDAEAKGGVTEDQYIAFAESLAGVTKDAGQLDSAKAAELKMAAADAYKKAFSLSHNGIYAYNVGVLYYNAFNDFADRFYNLRGESADLKAKRDAIEKQQQPIADTAIYYLEQGYDILKAKSSRDKSESNSLDKSVDFLANLYMWKRDRARGVNPTDYDKFDAKFKQYDSEHGKYQ